MKILITGCAGFLGWHLCDRFTKDGHEVTGVDNFITGERVHPDIEFIRLDVNSRVSVTILEEPDLILHFAALASPKAYYEYPILSLLAGSYGAKNMLDLAIGSKIVIASTSEVYGNPHEHPQKETYYGNCNPIGERSCYDESKRFQEALAMAYHREYDLDIRIVRIFNTYGPGMRADDGRVIPNFISQALDKQPLTIYGDGSQTRSFCYVDDLIDGIVTVIDKGDSQPYNIGNPEEVTMSHLARQVTKMVYGSEYVNYKNMDIYKDDPAKRQPDITRIKELGWSPKVGLTEGLKETIKYFKDERN